MKILVTGAAGFIASHLAYRLLNAGHAVTVLDDLSGGFERNVPPAAHFIKGSVVNHALVRFVCKQNEFDAIYHLAAYAAEGLSHFIRRFNYTNNVVGSVNVINAAVETGVKKLVFTSSMAVYGHADAPFFELTTPTVPADPYGAAKLAVEHDLAAAASMFGLKYTIFRPHNVIGTRQHIGDKYRNVAGIFMNQLLKGQPLTVYGDGKQTRAFSAVEDILDPMIRCLDMPITDGKVFNVGGAQPYTINQLARLVMEAAGTSSEVVHLQARNEVVHAHSDHTYLDTIFGTVVGTPIEVALARMWEWAKDLGPQDPTPAPEIEVEKNLPPSWVAK